MPRKAKPGGYSAEEGKPKKGMSKTQSMISMFPSDGLRDAFGGLGQNFTLAEPSRVSKKDTSLELGSPQSIPTPRTVAFDTTKPHTSAAPEEEESPRQKAQLETAVGAVPAAKLERRDGRGDDAPPSSQVSY